MTEQADQPKILQRLEERRESYADRSLVYRAAWVTASVIVIAAGIAMVVFPGPAVVVIPLGLAMLSFEFAWAQKVLDKGITQGAQAKDTVANASPRQKQLLAAAVLAAAALVATLAYIVFLG